ncbi:MAG: glycoside hydrolase family 97 catalytic domain-containing protein, partial [Halanaerobiales bacterium]|nr:glycoside hydrolase family 97 catalytic domain-containing protein [Halanaerobiales bacterium]
QKLSEVSIICERPLLAELSDTVFAALGEARLVDFARMKFEKDSSNSNKLKASLSKGDSKTSFIKVAGNGYNSPWRYVMAGQTPSEILQNNSLILNLNDKNKIEDTSWIKPGKVIREVTLTTKGGIACVDFAVKHNLQFIEFDAGWYGNEYDDASDATTVTVDPNRSPGPLDLQYVIDYAKENGIGVILYVNRRALEKQLDDVLPLVKSWGVDGLKYGFVNVGPQYWTDWLHDAVRKAADHELMVDIHDEYRPTGYSRTYPNLMTQEGIRGDEESTPNDMAINTIFTRMIAGAGDQTNCYFAERVAEKMGSHAAQMAKVICIYSPWQFVFWYDRPIGSPTKKGGAGGAEVAIPEIPDLTFYNQVPTVWDETKIIDGYPGELAVIARRDKEDWYLGVITGIKGHALDVDLNFLEEGKKYKATVYSHDNSLKTTTKVKIEEFEVTSKSDFKYQILEQNGLAVIFKPIS